MTPMQGTKQSIPRHTHSLNHYNINRNITKKHHQQLKTEYAPQKPKLLPISNKTRTSHVKTESFQQCRI